MPQIVNFNNRQIIEPGAYSQIKSGIPVPAAQGTYGNVMIIDTGVGAGFGWGSGVAGSLANGAQSIYSFDSPDDMKRAIRGGIIWDLMDYLWVPSKNADGPKKVYYARAATTVAASLTLEFDGSDLVIKPKTEGATANGVLQTNDSIPTLVSGYGIKLKAGINNTSKLILEFYEGQYRGADASGTDYDVAKGALTNYLLCRSAEFGTLRELYNWMYNDYVFNQFFTYSFVTQATFDVALDGAAEIVKQSTAIRPTTGGTTQYSSAVLDTLLESMEDLDNSLFLCLDSGITPNPAWTILEKSAGKNKGALATENSKILTYCLNQSTYTEKILFIAGGDNESEFTRPGTGDGSIEISKFYNSSQVVNIHSGIKVAGSFAASGIAFKYLPAIYHAALVCGRVAGLQPQVPVTYKDLRISGLQHEMKKSQRENALLSGVLHTRYQSQLGWVVNQGVNTLQSNSNLITPEGKSPEIQIMRIIHQINKELVINATTRFVGGNLATASAEEVKAFIEGYLTTRIATRLVDNLIIDFSQVTVALEQDFWKVKYCFVPNGPINRIFMTGFILDPKIEI